MNKKILFFVISTFLINGCTHIKNPFQPTHYYDYDKNGNLIGVVEVNSTITSQEVAHDISIPNIKKVKTKKLRINSLNTIVPKRSKEKIMRGIILPYQSDGIMHDSSYVYMVIKNAGWLTNESTKIRGRKILGGINGI